MRSCWTLKEIAPAHELTNWSVSQIRRRSGSKFKQLERINLLIYWFLLKWLFLLPKCSFVRLNTLEHDGAAAAGGNDNSIFDQLFWHQTIFTMGNEIMKVIYEIVPTWPLVVMIIPSGGNGFGSTVAMRSLSPKKGCLSPSKQSATTPKCYSTKVLQHQSATTPECHQCTKVVPPAWRSFGGTQKHGWRLEEHKRSSRRNGNGDSEEIQTVIREKYKHRRHGELGLDWEEMGGGGKLNIIEWEIYLGTEGGQKVSDNYFFPLSRFVFPSARKNEA